MKPNPEQGADRAAFEKFIGRYFTMCPTGDRTVDSWRGYSDWDLWQAAKADSRALQDAFEQVCGALDMIISILQNTTGEVIGIVTPRTHERVEQALAAAAPYRKLMGGV